MIEAIDQVRRDVAKVEIWAVALGEFAQPAPDYEPGRYTAWLMRERTSAD